MNGIFKYLFYILWIIIAFIQLFVDIILLKNLDTKSVGYELIIINNIISILDTHLIMFRFYIQLFHNSSDIKKTKLEIINTWIMVTLFINTCFTAGILIDNRYNYIYIIIPIVYTLPVFIYIGIILTLCLYGIIKIIYDENCKIFFTNNTPDDTVVSV